MPHPFTVRWYAGLPEAFRGLDAAGGGRLLGFLDALGQEVGAVTDLVARFDRRYPGDRGYDPAVDAASTSDLVDPWTADSAWLAWLGQLYGVRVERTDAPVSFAGTYGQLGLDYASYAALDAAFASYAALEDAVTPPATGLTDLELRTAIADRLGWRAGSTAAVRLAVQPWLIGARTVTFERHQGPVGATWARVNVHTLAAETPNPWQIPLVLARRGVAPAAVELVHVLDP